MIPRLPRRVVCGEHCARYEPGFPYGWCMARDAIVDAREDRCDDDFKPKRETADAE